MKEHQTIFEIGQSVQTVRSIRGWFDYSIKNELPSNSVGTIFKIHKLNDNINEIVYTVQFDKEFGFADIKHSNLEMLDEKAQET